MKNLLLSFFILTALFAKSQSVAEANEWFNKYEYAKAASTFELVKNKRSLNIEDYQKWCYSYFITGEYKECLPMSDSLLNRNDTPAYFYYVNGYTSMALKNYEKAKTSFLKYKTLDDEYEVDDLIKSCEEIPNWSTTSNIVNILVSNNSDKADFSGPFYNGQEINFHEGGKDSLGNLIVGGSLSSAELMMMRPYLYSKNGDKKEISLPDSLSDAALTSITFAPGSNDIFITLSKPLEEKQIDKVPHLYKAKLKGSNIENVSLWKYSGYEDTSSTAHATINESGNILVFSKIGNGTQSSDLFASQKSASGWSKPQPITSLNTQQDEMYPMFMGDSLLSFSSSGRTGYGGLDIFIAQVNNGAFTDVEHMKEPINSFNDDFNFLYYSIDSARYSSNRIGGVGDDDIYFIKFNEPKVAEDKPDSSDYFLLVDNWVDPIIYFDFDKFDMEKDVDKLEDLINFMIKYENSTVTIAGHADKRGTNSYNMRLGLKRATQVKLELVKRGVRPNQIFTTTKGKTDPQVDCSTGCTEKEHALNRVAIIHLQAK